MRTNAVTLVVLALIKKVKKSVTSNQVTNDKWRLLMLKVSPCMTKNADPDAWSYDEGCL